MALLKDVLSIGSIVQRVFQVRWESKIHCMRKNVREQMQSMKKMNVNVCIKDTKAVNFIMAKSLLVTRGINFLNK